MTLLTNPYDWHRAPDPAAPGPCPVCGSGVAGRRPHRRGKSDRFWIVRGVNTQPVVVAPTADHKASADPIAP
jgi:hypothetical protein